jgi:hypothetical protein
MIFLSAAHLEERAAARTREAEQLPPGAAPQHALNNAAQLRSYAAMKRLLVPTHPASAPKRRDSPITAIERFMRAKRPGSTSVPAAGAWVFAGRSDQGATSESLSEPRHVVVLAMAGMIASRPC